MSVTRFITIKKLALAISRSNWNSRGTNSFTFNCVFAAVRRRVTFFVAVCHVPACAGQFPFNKFGRTPVFKATVNIFNTSPIPTEASTL